MPTDLQKLTKRLKAAGVEEELLAEVVHELEAASVEETEGRIIRTNKGALMVRLSPDRWPIGMYAKDWKILLKLVPAIEHALKTMNILEENPVKSERQMKQLKAVRDAQRSVQVAPGVEIYEGPGDEEEGEGAA